MTQQGVSSPIRGDLEPGPRLLGSLEIPRGGAGVDLLFPLLWLSFWGLRSHVTAHHPPQ